MKIPRYIYIFSIALLLVSIFTCIYVLNPFASDKLDEKVLIWNHDRNTVVSENVMENIRYALAPVFQNDDEKVKQFSKYVEEYIISGSIFKILDTKYGIGMIPNTNLTILKDFDKNQIVGISLFKYISYFDENLDIFDAMKAKSIKLTEISYMWEHTEDEEKAVQRSVLESFKITDTKDIRSEDIRRRGLLGAELSAPILRVVRQIDKNPNCYKLFSKVQKESGSVALVDIFEDETSGTLLALYGDETMRVRYPYLLAAEHPDHCEIKSEALYFDILELE